LRRELIVRTASKVNSEHIGTTKKNSTSSITIPPGRRTPSV
jgi:hypothetical protein